MLKAALIILFIATSYWGYCNYKSYPKERKPSPCHRQHKEKDELHVFFGKWNPIGRDKPVFGGPKWKWGI